MTTSELNQPFSLSYQMLSLPSLPQKYEPVIMPQPVRDIIKTPHYRKACTMANVQQKHYRYISYCDLEWKEVEYRKQVAPLFSLTVDANTDIIIDVQMNADFHESAFNEDYEAFCKRALMGREAEKLVVARLLQDGIDVLFPDMVLDGITSCTAMPDLFLVPADDALVTTAWDVKMHYKEDFTDDWQSFPDEIRIDFCHAVQRKEKWCEKHGIKFGGFIHFSHKGGGMMFTPYSTKERWTTQLNTWDGKRRDEFVALYEKGCFRELRDLVARYACPLGGMAESRLVIPQSRLV